VVLEDYDSKRNDVNFANRASMTTELLGGCSIEIPKWVWEKFNEK